MNRVMWARLKTLTAVPDLRHFVFWHNWITRDGRNVSVSGVSRSRVGFQARWPMEYHQRAGGFIQVSCPMSVTENSTILLNTLTTRNFR